MLSIQILNSMQQNHSCLIQTSLNIHFYNSLIHFCPEAKSMNHKTLYFLWILRVSFQISLSLPIYNSMIHFCPEAKSLNRIIISIFLSHIMALCIHTRPDSNIPRPDIDLSPYPVSYGMFCYFSRYLNSNHYGNKSTVFCYFIQTSLNSNRVNSPVMFCPQLGVNTNWNQFTFKSPVLRLYRLFHSWIVCHRLLRVWFRHPWIATV